MIHGFRGTHDGMELISQSLEQDFFVICPDLPGFGDSEPFKPGSHSLENYSKFIDEFIQSLDLNSKPALLGHSFGSIISSKFAANHQSKITKLVLVNPIATPALENPKGALSKVTLLYYRVGAKLPGELGSSWLSAKPAVRLMSKAMTKTKDKDLVKHIDTQHLTHFSRFSDKASVLEAFEVSISHTVREFAPNISIPTLLIVGDKDDISLLDHQFELAKLFKQASVEVIRGVGHLIHYEDPASASKHIRNFIG